ncbi:MAG TPA: SpoIIE family protein phosphatase [Pirellulales bacterium]
MADSTPTFLRLYNEAAPAHAGRLADFWPGLDKLCRAFEQVTGWPLECRPGADIPSSVLWSAPAAHDGAEGEQLRVGVAAGIAQAAPPAAADLRNSIELAGAVGELLGDLARTRQALWKCEAELAAGMPLTLRGDEGHLAARLKASLRAAAEAVGMDAAALYVLDETAQYLKLRSVWRLPQERLLLPPRELSDAAADLEALLGHAITLEDTAGLTIFSSPEPAAAALCVPVSSVTAPLGTLWLFGDRPRSFSDREVNLVEIVAGRVAADLERETLITASADASRLKRQLSAAERWQEDQLPRTSPPSDLWQVAGWTQAAAEVNAEFYDWFVTGQEALAVVLGGARQDAPAGALCASALRGAVRAHAAYANTPAQVLRATNETFHHGSPGDQSAALFLALADVERPVAQVSAAGSIAVWKITAAGASGLARAASPLGAPQTTTPRDVTVRFLPNDLILVLSEAAARTCQEAGKAAEDELLSTVLTHCRQPAEVLVELVRDRLTALADPAKLVDASAVVLKCR